MNRRYLMDDRDVEQPEFTIDPMLSGSGNHGGDRPDRHRSFDHEGNYRIKTPAERATMRPKDGADV